MSGLRARFNSLFALLMVAGMCAALQHSVSVTAEDRGPERQKTLRPVPDPLFSAAPLPDDRAAATSEAADDKDAASNSDSDSDKASAAKKKKKKQRRETRKTKDAQPQSGE